MKKQRKHDSKNLDDLVVGNTQFVELNAQDAPKTNIDWDVNKVEVHSDPVFDPGTGGKAIIRRFMFALQPGLKEELTLEEMFDYHLTHTVIPMLHKDELELLDLPRIIPGKGSFTIVAKCSPRFVMGIKSHIHEEASNVTKLINESQPNTDKLH